MTDYQMDNLIQAKFEYLQELEERETSYQEIDDDDDSINPWSIQ